MEYRVEDFLSYKLHMIKTDKFKTINVKIIFSKKVEKQEITIRNFLSDFLVYASKKYPNYKSFSIALQDLYAMNVFSTSYRIGNAYNTDINATFLNEKYTEKGMFEKSIEFLSDIIFNPNVDNEQFDSKNFEVIKDGIKSQIESLKENTRKLSLIKMLDNMGHDEVFSYHGFGYIEDLEIITPKNLYEYYQDLIKTSKVDIYILGNIDFEETKKIINKNFKFNTIKMKKEDLIIYHENFRKIPKKIIESLPLSQSKLSIGCKIGKINDYDRNYVLPIYSIILGGGSNSKLFSNVREKNSLCYYISASSSKLDNILFITSGITKDNFEKVVKLVKQEIKNMEKGKFNEKDIEDAKTQYITMLDEFEESPFQIISSYYSSEVLGNDPLETRKQKVKNVSYDEVKNFSNNIHIDTIYLLKGDN